MVYFNDRTQHRYESMQGYIATVQILKWIKKNILYNISKIAQERNNY